MAKNLTPAHLRCGGGASSCPSVYELEDGRLLIVGEMVPHGDFVWFKEREPQARVGAGETAIIIDRELLANLSPWQLIGTAPKDGTYVLTGRSGDKFPLILHWLHLAWRDWNGVMHEPTHWQPLPLPPELIDRELLSGLDSALRTGEEGKSGVDVAEEAKGGSQANVEGSRGIGNEGGAALHPDDGKDAYFGAHGKVLRSRALEHPESPLARDLLIAAGWVDALNFKLQQAQRPIEEAGTADEVSAANTSASLTPHQEGE